MPEAAFTRWETLAPRYQLHLETGRCLRGFSYWAVSAHDEGAGCWVPVAADRDMKSAMTRGMDRVIAMEPDGPITEYVDPLPDELTLVV